MAQDGGGGEAVQSSGERPESSAGNQRPASRSAPGAATSKGDAGANAAVNRKDSLRIVAGAIVTSMLLFGALVAYSFQSGGPGWGAFGTGIAIGGGGLAVGAFLGLLFGVPRLLQQPPDQTGESSGNGRATNYQANTNLTEISDWLTKIIVGVSLIQLGTIRDQLLGLVAYLAPGMGGSSAAAPFVAGLLTSSSLIGFLTGYLLARIYLPRVFNEADLIERARQESRRVAVESATDVAMQQVTDSGGTDADALRLVEQQLTLGTTSPHPTQEQLDAAVQAASPLAREFIFNRAYDTRTKNWKEPDKKAAMELTIPIFRALLKANDNDHRAHAQLGYALKDQRKPDNEGSVAELTRAIEIRDQSGDDGWQFYEWNRALARVRIELAKGPAASSDDIKNQILADLGKAMAHPGLRSITLKDPDFVTWAERNGVDLKKL